MSILCVLMILCEEHTDQLDVIACVYITCMLIMVLYFDIAVLLTFCKYSYVTPSASTAYGFVCLKTLSVNGLFVGKQELLVLNHVSIICHNIISSINIFSTTPSWNYYRVRQLADCFIPNTRHVFL